ncbi:Protein of unknown function [Pyronema omphalodes CBS 100304]|uniref:Uncharacterized protein n=1 Tax=Pyronema omphalodes (strain CBS 100304) TaxID=1076935 RepID=U4KU44_PYROM|nr:Protein of unknown function [Pyronema omphalodes CBS 100304]
MLTLSDTDR